MGSKYEDDIILKTTEFTKEAIQKISEMHRSMYGVNHAKYIKMYSYFLKHVQDFYEELTNSCQMKVDELEKEAESKYLELDNLQKELNMNIDFTLDKSEPLTAIIDRIEESLRYYRSIKAERMETLNGLLEKESELCNILDTPRFPPISGTPSEGQLNELDLHVNKLQTEKLNRIETYRITKESIVGLMKELECERKQPIYYEIMNSTEETYNLKPDFMDKMKNLEDDLKQQFEDATKNVEYLKDKLNKLWERIGVEGNLMISFLNNIKGIGISFQDMLKKELARCEEIKRANIKPVIETVRREINEMWAKLTYTEQEKKQFITYYSDTFSDDVLTIHEMELLKLKAFYEDNKHIYDLAEKRESLWERMQHLDDVAHDKNRFKNRGGQLLKEERERKILETSVPKTDSQLKNYLKDYQDKTGKIFLWHGQDLLQKVVLDWENRLKTKEKNKVPKKIDDHYKMTPDCKETNNENYARSAKKRRVHEIPSENILQSPLKRKLPIKGRNQFTPSSAGNKGGIPPATNISAESLGSYSVFQEQIEIGSNSKHKRNARKEIISPLRAHSSPTTAPKKCNKTHHQRKFAVTPGK